MVIFDMEFPETCGECRLYDQNIRDCSICCHGKPIPPTNEKKPHWCPIKGEYTGWTPVSDGLPDRSMKCLLTVRNNDFGIVEPISVVIDYWVQKEGQMSLFDEPKGCFRNNRLANVVAWQPLPKEYKGE